MDTIGKVLYQEKCGECELFISEYGYDWIVGGVIEGKRVEKIFHASPYPEKNPYGLAIAMYDKTLDHASVRYSIARVLPEKPNFEMAINVLS